MNKVSALAVSLFCFFLSYATLAISACGDGWTNWWSGGYTDGLIRYDFPTTRPVTVGIFYRGDEEYQNVYEDYYIAGDDFFAGDPGDWELIIGDPFGTGNTQYGPNYFEFYTSGTGFWDFNQIDVLYPPCPPGSISVPTSSSTGNYIVSWSASATDGVTYHLQEATDSEFSTGLRTVLSSTTALTAQITGRTSGVTYYYRVRAEKADEYYSAWVNGDNGCDVVDAWTTWWSGGYTDGLIRYDFPTTRPVTVRIFYRGDEEYQNVYEDYYIAGDDFFAGDPGDWELIIGDPFGTGKPEYGPNYFEFYTSGTGFWDFNRIDVMYSNP
jgi:hypothetical protein